MAYLSVTNILLLVEEAYLSDKNNFFYVDVGHWHMRMSLLHLPVAHLKSKVPLLHVEEKHFESRMHFRKMKMAVLETNSGKSQMNILLLMGCRIGAESPVKALRDGFVPDLQRIAGTED